MGDVPQRLPCPEKRSDKISKNDMRYLSKLQSIKNKTVQREKLNTEIAEERRTSEKRHRVSKGGSIKKQTKVKIKLTHNKTRKRAAPEIQLLQKSHEVIQGTHPLPCVLSRPLQLPSDAHNGDHEEMDMEKVEEEEDDDEQCDSQDQYRLTEGEIKAQFDNAIIWKENDYPHIIPHDDLWVFCNYCHKGLPSTQLRVWARTPLKCYHEEGKFFDCVFINHANKFLIYHDECAKEISSQK
jgi:hypothetical protein